jgi:hypothetical protein
MLTGGVYDAELVEQRRTMHQQLALPEDRPLFRASNAWDMYKLRAPGESRCLFLLTHCFQFSG